MGRITKFSVIYTEDDCTVTMKRRNRGMTENTNEMKKWRGTEERVQFKFE